MRRTSIRNLAVVAGIAAAPAAYADEAGVNAQVSELVVRGVLDEAPPLSTKADIPVLEQSQAVSVVSEQAILDQGLRRLPEVLFNVAGASRSNNYGFFDGFNIRGFNASSGSTYLDGLLDDTGYGTNEVLGLERVEVVKGPASGLYGQGPLSGIINQISKRPQDDRFVDVLASAGSYNLFELGVDANAPLADSLTGRLSLIYRDQDFFVDASGQRRVYVAPALTWRPTDSTSLTLLARYVEDDINPWSPTTAYGTVLPNPNGDISIKLSINDEKHPAIQENEYWNLGYVFDHRFSDAVAFHQSLRYQDFHNSWDRWLFVSSTSADFRQVGRFYYGPYNENGEYFRVDSNFSFRFDTGAVSHYVLAGVDVGYRVTEYTNLFDPGPYFLDLYNPIYGTVAAPNPAVPSTRTKNWTKQRGLYIQDHLKVGERLAFTLGGRWDEASSKSVLDGIAGAEVEDTAFSPRAGATFKLSDWAALYVNYAKSFSPQGSYRDAQGDTLPPEEGVNYEAGVKVQRADGSLSGMATIFELTRANVATADLSPLAPPNTYLITGEQRSRGVELEGGWRPTPEIELSAAYTYLDAKVTADSRLRVGARLANIPNHIVNLWGRYTFRSGPLENLGFSAGVHHESSRPASTASGAAAPIHLDGYTLADAGVFYSFRDWQVQANVRNLFDKRYFPTASTTRTTPGEPRTFVVSVQRRF